MDINENLDLPGRLEISFNKVFDYYEKLSKSKDDFLALKANRIIALKKKHPELNDGFSESELLKKHEKSIEIILQEFFAEGLTLNEIKTASFPFIDVVFNSSERFKKIVNAAGKDFELEIKNLPEIDRYIMACTIILQACYGFDVDFKRPLQYEIPNAQGIIKTYKILYNADFTEILPTDKAKKITQDDIDELLDGFDNIELWKEKFPPQSYIFKGFVISNMFDITADSSISNIKSTLLKTDKRKSQNFMTEFQSTFESLFNLKDIKIGFITYDEIEQKFNKVLGKGMDSFLLNNEESRSCKTTLCGRSYKRIVKEKKYYSVSDVEKYFKLSEGKAPQYKTLHKQGIKSAILAPIADNGVLMGVLELVSMKKGELNSINANKLEDVMPYIISSVIRSKNEEENLIEAIIQQECTSIHPSVHWKFERAARQFIIDQHQFGNDAVFNDIIFENVYPLFGQMDIKGSSEARNWATQQDLVLQLNNAKQILHNIYSTDALPIYEQVIFQIDSYLNDIDSQFKVDSEQQISRFLKDEIEPLFQHFSASNKNSSDIEVYFNSIDKDKNVLYRYRKEYDDTIMLINREMASLLDRKQIEAQQMHPHYFERFKTDGVEHNMYIGESITKEISFNNIFLFNLRLWQLQVMCEMENAYYQMRDKFPISLDVASMILVFNQALSISFRMDEKHFDVDGTYNARYEIVKKRVDKAFIKGTTKRITEKGMLTIVYSQKKDEYEYLSYIKFLQSKNYLDTDEEIVELEDLQAVTGLKALRVSVLYHKDQNDKEFYTYEDLMKEI